MKNLKIIVFLSLFFILALPAGAIEPEAVSSGRLISLVNQPLVDERPAKLKAYLEAKNSPCSENAADFIYFADKYGLDWKLGPAIAGIESSFCQIYPLEENNPFGIAGGYYHFNSLKEAIEYLNQLIATNGYYTKFQQTRNIFDLSLVYCELSEKWANAVSKFMLEIDSFSAPASLPDKIDL
jgi:hypothetical protein